MKSLGIAVVIGLLVLAGIIGGWMFIMNVQTDNKEIDKRTEFEAQEQVCKGFSAKMFNILKEKAKVSDKYKEGFKDIYKLLVEGREGGELMKFVQEANPNFDISLYKDLMASIEIERNGFFNEQKKLIDIHAEHTRLLKKFPTKFFIDDDVKLIELKVITSAATKEVYATGEDNGVDLFDDNKQDTTKK